MLLATVASVKDIAYAGKSVLVRVDFNVPLKDGAVANAGRIEAALPTIRFLLDAGASKVVLMSHLGRPDGRRVDELSLRPVAAELERLIGDPVRFIGECVGDAVVAECRSCPERLVLLENLRFHVEEEGKCKLDDGTVLTASKEDVARFRASLSQLGSVFVNDAFGTVHRAHSSIAGVALEPRVAGLLVQKELAFFARVLEGPEKLHTLILGGAKVSDKILLIENMLDKAENIVIGGAMAFTFLSVLYGTKIGDSLYDHKGADIVPAIMDKAAQSGVKIHLPVDFVVSPEFKEDGAHKTADIATGIEDGWMGLDIGPKSIAAFTDVIRSADGRKGRVILWNGPMGVFEWAGYAGGTEAVLRALVEATAAGCITIVGGGDSAAAVAKWHCDHDLSHVSTGGGASLELLEGRLLVPTMSEDLIVFGHPFPSLETDNKSHVPVWKQQATNDKGHKRFHGAFEGGFSAGYFNTVGSKEGWQPSEFTSSRTKKEGTTPSASAPEQFMDEEDTKEFNTRKLAVKRQQSDLLLEGLMLSSGLDKDALGVSHDVHVLVNRYKSQPKSRGPPVRATASRSEAFGGGAWDEDDEQTEMYDTSGAVSEMAPLRKDFEQSSEQSKSLRLNFSDAVSLSDDHCFAPPELPEGYVPIRINTPLLPSAKLAFSKDRQPLMDPESMPASVRIVDVDEKTAALALKGFVPFGEDPERQARYVRYLKACIRRHPEDLCEISRLEEREKEDFVLSAQVFKPVSSVIAVRFESASQPVFHAQPKGGLHKPDSTKKPPPVVKQTLPLAEESKTNASSRFSFAWSPATLLCKRFNVEPSSDVKSSSVAEASSVKPVLAEEPMEHLLSIIAKEHHTPPTDAHQAHEADRTLTETIPDRPSDDLFEAIFGNDVPSKPPSSRAKAADFFT